MNCLDCDKPIRSNAKRCTRCSARHYMEMRSRKLRASREPRICANDACKVEFIPARSNQTHCTKECKNRKDARLSFQRFGQDKLASRAEASRQYRARIKKAREEQKARELAERIERINAKARQMMAA